MNVDGDEEKTAAEFTITIEQVNRALKMARQILFDKRNKRPRPRLDTKIIVSWNGNFMLQSQLRLFSEKETNVSSPRKY